MLNSINSDHSYDKEKITIILYDDCSTDTSSEIIKDFIHRHGDNYNDVIYERGNESSGGNVARAINRCFELAKNTYTKYVFNIEADVVIPEDTFGSLVSLLEGDSDIGMVSVPYTYLGENQKSIEVDITMGCAIISRKLLDSVSWKIDERFTNTNDLWLVANAEKKGLKVLCDRTKRAGHLKPLIYKEHIRNKFFQLPHYHYLLLKDGLLTRRLLKRYVYYGTYLIIPILFLLNPFFSLLIGPVLIAGIWHYRSVRRFLYAFPVGIAMVLGIIKEALKDIAQRALQRSCTQRISVRNR